MVKIVDLEHKWATLIGRMFVAFGSIESNTHRCIEAFTDEVVAKHLNNQQLSKRIAVLQDLINDLDTSPGNRNEFLDILNRAKVLSEKRNLIAHNPLVLHVFNSETEGMSMQETIISTKNRNKQIGFEELSKIAIESEYLSSGFHKIMAVLRGEGFNT